MVTVMIVSIKDSVKLFGISIMACCAVFVCNMFLNYYLDLTAAADLINDFRAQSLYDAQLMTSKVVCSVSGTCTVKGAGLLGFKNRKRLFRIRSERIYGLSVRLSYVVFDYARIL